MTRLSAEARGYLTFLQQHYGMSQPELFEALLREEHARVVAEEQANPPVRRVSTLPVLSTDVDEEEEIDAADTQRFAGMVALTRREQARSG